jgi:hypothetical protein
MVKLIRTKIRYEALRKECLEAVKCWPGCETIAGIQLIRNNSPAGFSVRITPYGKADKRIADRAMIYVEREKRRQFWLDA